VGMDLPRTTRTARPAVPPGVIATVAPAPHMLERGGQMAGTTFSDAERVLAGALDKAQETAADVC
jgi:hypothetical protein